MFRNSSTSYGWVAIAFHWISAIVVLGMFGLGLYMVELSYYDPWYRDALNLHKATGVLVACLISMRLTWKYLNLSVKSISSERSQRIQNLAASSVHVLMYTLLVMLFLSGYLISTEDGRGIEVFGVFILPSIGQLFEHQSDISGTIHLYMAWGLIVLVIVHVFAALYHHFVLKDLTLKRMCIPQGDK